MLNVALPKGRLGEKVLTMFEKAGFECPAIHESGRKLIFENPEILDRLDIKIFVNTDADVRILRRIQRDVSERGRDLNSVISQYITTVKPMHEAFVEPSKRYADIIVPEGGMNRVAIEMITQRIISHLEKKGTNIRYV